MIITPEDVSAVAESAICLPDVLTRPRPNRRARLPSLLALKRHYNNL